MATALERRIDALYKAPLDRFVAARNALARAMGGGEARRVKALAKPTAVAWTVNQLRWQRPSVYDWLLKSGARRRAAEIAALGGGRADVASLAQAHRQAIAEALRVATELAGAAGVRVDREPLARMLEAVSVAADLAEPHGRLTKPLGPAGFEALLGLTVRTQARRPEARPVAVDMPAARRTTAAAEQRAADERRAADARRRQLALDRAEAALATARREEMRAQAAWDRARKQVTDAEQALDQVRQSGHEGD